MEPEIRIFLVTIVQTMSYTLLWMALVTWFGIKEGLMFFDNGFTIWNGLFYLGMVASFVWTLRFLLRMWKKVPRFGRPEDL